MGLNIEVIQVTEGILYALRGDLNELPVKVGTGHASGLHHSAGITATVNALGDLLLCISTGQKAQEQDQG